MIPKPSLVFSEADMDPFRLLPSRPPWTELNDEGEEISSASVSYSFAFGYTFGS